MKPAETLGGTVLSNRTARGESVYINASHYWEFCSLIVRNDIADTSVEAPPLPIDPPPEPKPEKERLQDFLDDLLG